MKLYDTISLFVYVNVNIIITLRKVVENETWWTIDMNLKWCQVPYDELENKCIHNRIIQSKSKWGANFELKMNDIRHETHTQYTLHTQREEEWKLYYINYGTKIYQRETSICVTCIIII